MSCSKESIRAIISSKKRRNPTTETSSNFTFSFGRSISRITEIIIESVQIPFSFYAINSNNNVLTFNNGAIHITITPGNYAPNSLTTEIKKNMDLAFSDTTTIVTFSFGTAKLTIARGTSFKVDAKIDQPLSTASALLGFNISSTTATSVKGDSVINISGPNYISIVSNVLTNPINHTVLFANNTYTNVLTTIPVNVSPFDIITLYYKITNPIRLGYKFGMTASTVIDISIIDDDGNVLNMNGADISMQVVFITE